jgi:hypothetical protein
MPELLQKAECTTEFSILREGDEITISVKIHGMPDTLLARIVEKGEDMSGVMVRAIMETIGAVGIEKDEGERSFEFSQPSCKESVH